MKQTVLIIIFKGTNHTTAKQVSCEQVDQHYKKGFNIVGNKVTYYPTVFKYGQQNPINHLKINQY